MWWYSYGWWWWWFLFLFIFFLIPLAYGWGYRDWGPWYRRTHRPRTERGENLADVDTGWGWFAYFLWVILIISFIWLIFAWAAYV